MGADLIVGHVSWIEGTTPNWEAAEALIAKVASETEVQQSFLDAYNSTCTHGNRYELKDIGAAIEIEDLVNEAAKAMKYVQELFAGDAGRNTSTIYTALPDGLVVITAIAGDMSWGDTPDGVDEITFFQKSELARAAGFLTVPRASHWRMVFQDLADSQQKEN